jgi:hypothetical protein
MAFSWDMRRIPAVMLVAVLATGAGAAQASATTAREAKATKHHAKPKVKHKAKSGPKLTVGETFAASGNGQSYKVTLISYTPAATDLMADPSTSANYILQPGEQFDFFCFKVTNTGSKTATGDAIGNNAAVGSDGKNYPQGWAGSLDGPGCPGIGNSGYTLSPKQSVMGGFAFQAPPSVRLTSISWSPSDGFGGTTAHWTTP